MIILAPPDPATVIDQTWRGLVADNLAAWDRLGQPRFHGALAQNVTDLADLAAAGQLPADVADLGDGLWSGFRAAACDPTTCTPDVAAAYTADAAQVTTALHLIPLT